ncbi:MAG: hypothetical protein QMC69_03980, partial [Gammaproteobacteria bacterium]
LTCNQQVPSSTLGGGTTFTASVRFTSVASLVAKLGRSTLCMATFSSGAASMRSNAPSNLVVPHRFTYSLLLNSTL